MSAHRSLIVHDGTTTEFGDDWRALAACGGRPEEFDLDVIGRKDSKFTVADAIRTCTRKCPVFYQCKAWTDSLTGGQRPQAVVQAGKEYKPKAGRR